MQKNPLWFCLPVLALSLTACVNPKPVTLSSQYQGPAPAAKAVHAAAGNTAPVCRVQLGAVADKRSDTESMGSLGGRPVRAVDTAGWLRSGLESLGQDGRIRLVDAGVASDLVLGADLLKGYVMSLTTAKTADVVLRVRISLHGAPATDKIYRGTEEGPNWTAGDGETQGALNRALAQALEQVQNDILARCAGAGG